MLDELRLNPRSPAAQLRGGRHGESAATDGGSIYGGLSTGFAEGAWGRSTGGAGDVGRHAGSPEKEEVA